MDGFKNSTKTKYMCGGPVKKATGGVVKKAGGGGVYNERGKRATNAEIAAEGRRMEGRKPPVEGISTRPTDSSGRRMTDKELGMTPGGVSPAKKMMPKTPASGIGGGALAGAAAGALAGAAARAGARVGAKAIPRGMGAMSDREMQLLKGTAKKGVPAHSSKPMIRRSKGGLTAMPKGKC
jgi:hypothetical protein